MTSIGRIGPMLEPQCHLNSHLNSHGIHGNGSMGVCFPLSEVRQSS